jgi:hypothetical protein
VASSKKTATSIYPLRIKWDKQCNNYILIGMEKPGEKRPSPPRSENLKLREKSEVFSDVTHVSKRSYQFHMAPMVKVLPQ